MGQHRQQEGHEVTGYAGAPGQRRVQPQRQRQTDGFGRHLVPHGELMGEGQRTGIVQHLGAMLFDIFQRANAGGGAVNLLTLAQRRQKIRPPLRHTGQRRIAGDKARLPPRDPRQGGKVDLRPVQDDLLQAQFRLIRISAMLATAPILSTASRAAG